MGIEGITSTKVIYYKSTADIFLSGEKLKAFPLRSRIRQDCPSSTLLLNSFGSPTHSNQKKKEVRGMQIEKEEVKLSLFADYMILYIENIKDATRANATRTNQ